jgi:cytidylate kinase
VRKPIITIDGPAGSGKSTLCRLLARALGLECLDTGAMYRAVAWLVRDRNPDSLTGEALQALLAPVAIEIRGSGEDQQVTVDGQDVSREIRNPEIAQWASNLSTRVEVRKILTEKQRQQGRHGGLVAEGRDMGTVVFPEAEHKFYLEAALAVRAERRLLELRRAGFPVDRDQVREDLARRDRQDSQRALAPLRPADGAEIIDTSHLTIEAVLARMLSRIDPLRDDA